MCQINKERGKAAEAAAVQLFKLVFLQSEDCLHCLNSSRKKKCHEKHHSNANPFFKQKQLMVVIDTVLLFSQKIKYIKKCPTSHTSNDSFQITNKHNCFLLLGWLYFYYAQKQYLFWHLSSTTQVDYGFVVYTKYDNIFGQADYSFDALLDEFDQKIFRIICVVSRIMRYQQDLASFFPPCAFPL